MLLDREFRAGIRRAKVEALAGGQRGLRRMSYRRI
jgi:hypothetical protein